jgi:acyl-CoA synthetase (AMP-forming)/AMP-acid ligase II/acyl carrier protein
MSQTLYRILEEQAQKTPNADVLGALGQPYLSYGRLLELVKTAAAELSSAGCEPNSRIALVLPNGPEMATAFLAAAVCATAAPLNPSFTAEEFAFYLSDLKAKALLVQVGDDTPARGAAGSLGIPVLELAPAANAAAGAFRLIPSAGSSTGWIPSARSDTTALVLHTSGTTSKPKIVPLTHGNICTSAANIRDSLELVREDRCLNVMPLFHIHGLIASLLASLYAGAGVVCAPGFQAPRFFQWFRECRPTWFTAVPTMHHSILRHAREKRPIPADSQLRFIRSCSSPLHPKLMSEMEEFFQVPMIEAYGMTEASHQMASNPLPPGVRKPGSVGIATGPDVAVMNERGDILPPEETGEIVLTGDNVMGGYEDNPEANRDAFTHGWFRTGDEGYFDRDRYLFITGRIKEIINRGGEKISPREVDEVLMDHPLVSQAAAFPLPDPQMGEEIAAAVVLHQGGSADEKSLQQFAEQRLAPYKVPRRMLIVDRIPKGPTGKLQRLGLAKALGLTALPQDRRTSRRYRPPGTDVERFLTSLWGEILGIEEVGTSAPFLDLGGDSILAGQIIARIRSRLEIEVTLSDFFDSPTVAQMARIIEGKLAKNMNDHTT